MLYGALNGTYRRRKFPSGSNPRRTPMHSHQPLRTIWLTALTLSAAWLIPAQSTRAGFLDPSSFTSLGALPTETGSYLVNTQMGQTPTMQLPDGTTIQGVVS